MRTGRAQGRQRGCSRDRLHPLCLIACTWQRVPGTVRPVACAWYRAHGDVHLVACA
ncbi:MAG: hypothetical protein K6E86_10540 [Bacteroidales bacterium]|nr:hypothetical protein [Bacteroidales bacterium]